MQPPGCHPDATLSEAKRSGGTALLRKVADERVYWKQNGASERKGAATFILRTYALRKRTVVNGLGVWPWPPFSPERHHRIYPAGPAGRGERRQPRGRLGGAWPRSPGGRDTPPVRCRPSSSAVIWTHQRDWKNGHKLKP